MLAVPGELPPGPGWAYEAKWDGVRAVAYINKAGKLKLLSRNDLDVTKTYAEIEVLGSLVPGQAAVLDGELVTLDRHGVPSFAALQRRMHVVSPSPALIASAPVQYMVFDLMYLDRSLIAKPWSQRRARLEQLELNRLQVLTPPVFYSDPDAVMEAVKGQGMEGIVSKRNDSIYEPGKRSHAWRKTALIQTTEVIIGGYKPGGGRRAGTVGSLLLGIHDAEGRLAYVGGVGTGFTDAMLTDLHRRLRSLETVTSPFATTVPTTDAKGARWVKPVLVGEVVYRTITPDGRLRHSSWRGLRPDRDPAEVNRWQNFPTSADEFRHSRRSKL
ncbi:MAG TPA: DNA ligase [Micromonosporaceae bacterium]|nr:DNA ligase [Micromonosporaceae bacterium]